MPARNLVHWLLPAMLLLTCGVAWLAIRADLSSHLASTLTWILSTEVLPLALVAGSAWLTHWMWRSHHTWRQQQ